MKYDDGLTNVRENGLFECRHIEVIKMIYSQVRYDLK